MTVAASWLFLLRFFCAVLVVTILLAAVVDLIWNWTRR